MDPVPASEVRFAAMREREVRILVGTAARGDARCPAGEARDAKNRGGGCLVPVEKGLSRRQGGLVVRCRGRNGDGDGEPGRVEAATRPF